MVGFNTRIKHSSVFILSQLTIKIAPWHVLLSRLVYLKIILDRGTGRSKISLGIISPHPPAPSGGMNRVIYLQ